MLNRDEITILIKEYLYKNRGWHRTDDIVAEIIHHKQERLVCCLVLVFCLSMCVAFSAIFTYLTIKYQTYEVLPQCVLLLAGLSLTFIHLHRIRSITKRAAHVFCD